MTNPEDVMFSPAVKAEQMRLGSRLQFEDREDLGIGRLAPDADERGAGHRGRGKAQQQEEGGAKDGLVSAGVEEEVLAATGPVRPEDEPADHRPRDAVTVEHPLTGEFHKSAVPG